MYHPLAPFAPDPQAHSFAPQTAARNQETTTQITSTDDENLDADFDINAAYGFEDLFGLEGTWSAEDIAPTVEGVPLIESDTLEVAAEAPTQSNGEHVSSWLDHVQSGSVSTAPNQDCQTLQDVVLDLVPLQDKGCPSQHGRVAPSVAEGGSHDREDNEAAQLIAQGEAFLERLRRNEVSVVGCPSLPAFD